MQQVELAGDELELEEGVGDLLLLGQDLACHGRGAEACAAQVQLGDGLVQAQDAGQLGGSGRLVLRGPDRKSTRLNSSHSQISYAVFCLKKKKKKNEMVSCLTQSV